MRLFSVFKKDLLILLRDRVEMAILFIMPLAFILPISFALGAGDGYGIHRNNQMMALPVADYDGNSYAQALMNSIGESIKLEKEFDADRLKALNLQDDPDCALDPIKKTATAPACAEKVGAAMLERSWRPAVLVIPKDFSSSIDNNRTTQVVLFYDPGGDAASIQQMEGVVKGATIKTSLQNQVGQSVKQLNDLTLLGSENLRQAVENQSHQPTPRNQQAAILVVKKSPSSVHAQLTPDTYQQTIPGYTVMYVFFIITATANSIRRERQDGTLRRLISTPISRSELLSGKFLASLLIGLLQVFLLFGIGALVFKLHLGTDPLAFFLLTVMTVSTAAAMGMAISTTRYGSSVLIAPLIIAALLGGCMIPLDLMPSFLQKISYLMPHRWALTAYQDLMVRGKTAQDILPHLAVLLGFTVVFFLITIRRFKFDNQEAG
jgi:ABC-2 type transport system permease protein